MPPAFRNKPTQTAKTFTPRALVAASQRVMHPNGGVAYRPEDHRIVEWQQQAWNFYDLIGELRYGARYYGNALSQLRLEIGWKPSSGSSPQPIDLENPPEGFNRAQYEIAVSTLDRLHSSEGSINEILRAYGVNLFVAGEGYLVGRTDRETGVERWDFYSTEQLVWLNSRWYLKENVLWKTDQLIELSGDDYVIRVWQAHPRYSDEPDSPLRSVLSLCEELLLLSANVRATALSRIPAGILLMPDTMLDAGPDYEPENLNNDAAREQQSQSTLEDIYNHFITPIADPNSAAAVAPFILTGDPEDLEQVRLIEFDREVDQIAAEQRHELITRIAHGIDLPSEILSGIGQMNHWSAWAVEEMAYKAHIAPAAALFCGAITANLIWPAIQVATGQDVDQRLVVMSDPIDLISHIDRRMNAKDGHSSLVISDATYRRALGFSDDDAPDDLEYKRRMALQQAALSLTPVAAGEIDSVTQALDDSVARVRPGVPTPESITADPDPRGRAPDIERPIEPNNPADIERSEPDTLVAAATRIDLGARLVTIDARLLDRLEILASAAMKRALEKAGARVRSRVSRDPEKKALVASAPAHEVAFVLGRETVETLFDNVSLLTGEEFEDFGEQFDSLTRRAQKQVRQLAKEYGLSEAEIVLMEQQQNVERDAAWLLLSGALVAVAASLLYRPKISPIDLNGEDRGEFDEISLVPTYVIRAALSAAGGNMGVGTSGGAIIDIEDRPLGLLATGETADLYFQAAGLSVGGYRWVYGEDDRVTFEPHLDLDGTEFVSFEDEILSNTETFPDTAFFFPGDHNGCRCLIEYIYEMGT